MGRRTTVESSNWTACAKAFARHFGNKHFCNFRKSPNLRGRRCATASRHMPLIVLVGETLEFRRAARAAAGTGASSTTTLPGTTAVDVGCSSGATTRTLARKFARVVGLDVSEPMLVKARATPTAKDTH